MHDRERSRTAWAVLTHVRSHSFEITVLHQSYLLYLRTRVVYYHGGIPSVRSPQLGRLPRSVRTWFATGCLNARSSRH